MDTRCQHGTVEKPEDFHLVLFWLVFQNRNITYNVHVTQHLKIFLNPDKSCPFSSTEVEGVGSRGGLGLSPS